MVVNLLSSFRNCLLRGRRFSAIMAGEIFDHIIVGGGTAGLVVANRLSEDSDVSVLVIEAGQDQSQNPLVLTPGLAAGLLAEPEYMWNFVSKPQMSRISPIFPRQQEPACLTVSL